MCWDWFIIKDNVWFCMVVGVLIWVLNFWFVCIVELININLRFIYIYMDFNYLYGKFKFVINSIYKIRILFYLLYMVLVLRYLWILR